MASSKLTPTQRAIVKAMREGAKLFRYGPQPHDTYYLTPLESVIGVRVRAPTARILIKDGYIQEAFGFSYELSPAGRAAAVEDEHE